METFSRSHTRSRAAATKTTTATFSGDNFKKQKPPLFSPSYDAVYAGASKCGTTPLAPRPEDYSEIFGGFRSSSSSRACSIPVLDLPAVSDIDSVTSVFDYSEIFAGFHGVDFAVPFDELFQPFDASADGCSSDDAWTPVGTESLSDDSDPFASSEKSQCFSHENSHQPLDSKKFTVSYHKVNSGASSCIPNTTHVESVHGYTCVVDGTTFPREMETEKGRPFVADDIVFSMNSSSSTLQKHKSTTMSGDSFDAGLKSVDSDNTCERPCYSDASMSHANSKYAFVSGTSLQTESHFPPPSIPPPVLTERKGDVKRSSTDLKASNGYASKVAVDSRLPPCFDMEVNANSSAAVSAAAMKDAMDKAQAKLKAAKVLLDRKKDGLQPYMRTDVHGSDDITIVLDCADGHNKVQTGYESGSAGVNSFVKDGHVTSTSQSFPGNVSVEQRKVITRKTAEKKHGKKCSLSKDTVSSVEDGEWKEATWYDDKFGLEAPSNGGGHIAVRKRRDDGNEQSSNSAEEACLPEGNRRKLKATNAVSRQEYHDRLMKVAQQVHESDICAHAKTDPRLTGYCQENHRDQKTNLAYEQEKNASTIGLGQSTEGESLSEATRIEATKGRSNNVPGKEEFKQNETDDHCQGQNDGVMYARQQSRIKEFTERKEEERRMGVSYERVECEGRLQENIAKLRKQSKHDVVRQKKENERSEMNGSTSIELFKDDLGGEELQTALGNLEKGKAKELKKVDDKQKEAFLDVPIAGSVQRTCYVHESDQKKDSLQRQENGNYFRVADDCRGSGSILEDDVLLESHSKCEETSMREIRMQRLSECLQFSDNKADQGLKQDNNEEKLERVTEQKTNDKKSMHVSEMEEAVNIQKKSSYAENEEAVSSTKDEWDDEDHGSGRSSEIDLRVKNGHLKPSNGANLCENTAEVDPGSPTSETIKPQTEATGFPDVSAWEKNVEDSAVASDEESMLEDAETAEVLDDDKPVDSTDAQMAAIDNEHERVVHGQDSLDVNNIRSKSDGVCGNNGLRFQNENKKGAESVADPNLVTDANIEQGGRRILDENHTPFDPNWKVKSTLSDGNNGRNENTKDREAACTETLQKKECTNRRSQLRNNSLNTEQKGTSIDNNCSYEVKTKEKERTLEEEQLRKLEEEREREREREKDRMAVELAIREARQRAYADARDRAERLVFERATDEARQKAMAEARERLEKACAEARERSLADKTSDARLRAERAAVERATAEARQRAFEKAMAERATLEARERMQRSISEKFTSERDVITRQSSMPTMHNVKSEAPDGEPAQRCRARLERHRRTVERVAKALAEKNMRDLVAQREQAERSRFAETLYADIKRWSSGKEGNLRALLSTLQYILAPDSGWQPIPLTEVITAAAVKKAYRKATLCVHPDKLQQRGASIQQKYICEKVFDLLKDAWNKFNSEEK